MQCPRPLVVHYTDGEHYQLEAAIRQVEEGYGCAEQLGVIAAKWNASRSAVDQPLDQNFFYKIQRSVDNKTYDHLPACNNGRVAHKVKEELTKIQAQGVAGLNDAKIECIANAFNHLPYYLVEAATAPCIIKSFQAVGMAPVSFSRMARRTPGWSRLHKSTQA
jgi:hypothetical protein